jgi:hypothetical protein
MFSVVIPCDFRWELLDNTLRAYHDLHPQAIPGLEFIIATREPETSLISNHGLDVKVYRYVYEKAGWCGPAKAFNEGIRLAKNNRVIITCPEVVPLTPVLYQFAESPGKTLYAYVIENVFGTDLVSDTFKEPFFYFLAVYNKKDLERLNGWDETFMEAYGREEEDFGRRFTALGLTYEVRMEIKAVHMTHPTPSPAEKEAGRLTGDALHEINKRRGILKPENGLIKLRPWISSLLKGRDENFDLILERVVKSDLGFEELKRGLFP